MIVRVKRRKKRTDRVRSCVAPTNAYNPVAADYKLLGAVLAGCSRTLLKTCDHMPRAI